MTRGSTCALLVLALVLHCSLVHRASAQEFAGTTPGAQARGPGAVLEWGLVGAPATGMDVAVTRWFALPTLQTRAAALGAVFRSLHVALGAASTGEPDVGWDALAIGVGVGRPVCGVGIRAAVRRDRDWVAAPAGVLGRAVGAESGAGAWLQPGARVRVWVSAPQLWQRGVAAPLARPLESGVRLGDAQCAGWLVLRAASVGDDGARAAGLWLGRGPLACWAEVSDTPLRASVGVRAVRGMLACGARLDTHPVLGETTRLSLAWAPQRAEPR